MSFQKLGYRVDNDDYLPEGCSFAQITRALNKPNCGSIKQVVRACIDEGGIKPTGGASDETGVTNNYNAFVLFYEQLGSYGLTLQARGFHKREERREENIEQQNESRFERRSLMTEQHLENKKEIIEHAIEQEEINEGFYPFSTIPR